jgi:hypothetical protein
MVSTRFHWRGYLGGYPLTAGYFMGCLRDVSAHGLSLRGNADGHYPGQPHAECFPNLGARILDDLAAHSAVEF